MNKGHTASSIRHVQPSLKSSLVKPSFYDSFNILFFLADYNAEFFFCGKIFFGCFKIFKTPISII